MKISNQYSLVLVTLVILLFDAGRAQSPEVEKEKASAPKEVDANSTKSNARGAGL